MKIITNKHEKTINIGSLVKHADCMCLVVQDIKYQSIRLINLEVAKTRREYDTIEELRQDEKISFIAEANELELIVNK